MEKGRILYKEVVKDHPNLGIYGIFNTEKVKTG